MCAWKLNIRFFSKLNIQVVNRICMHVENEKYIGGVGILLDVPTYPRLVLLFILHYYLYHITATHSIDIRIQKLKY